MISPLFFLLLFVPAGFVTMVTLSMMRWHYRHRRKEPRGFSVLPPIHPPAGKTPTSPHQRER